MGIRPGPGGRLAGVRTMTEKLRQSLSAVIDDEADAFELRRVLDELGRDSDLRTLWDRYHLIGNVMRGERGRPPAGLRDRVWDALESGADAAPASAAASAVPTPAASPANRFGRMTGLAVAASVAFAVVIGFNGLEFDDGEAVPAVAGTPVPAPAPAAEERSGPLVAATAPRADAAELEAAAEVRAADVQRAQAYMLHHAQQQALNQAGVMSFVKLATYEAP